MSRSIAVLGAGPGLGRALGRRYARDGYTVAFVARRPDVLDRLVAELAREGARAHPIAADLADTDAAPELAARVRDAVGDPEVLYYGAAADGFVPVLDLTPQRVRDLVPLGVSALVALVGEFLPAMLTRGDGAILTAQGASALRGNPTIAGGLVLAAQRNYLQALHAEVAGKGVHVGALYIGAAIEGTPFHERITAAGAPPAQMPTVDPAHLAELLRTLHVTRDRSEITYPARPAPSSA